MLIPDTPLSRNVPNDILSRLMLRPLRKHDTAFVDPFCYLVYLFQLSSLGAPCNASLALILALVEVGGGILTRQSVYGFLRYVKLTHHQVLYDGRCAMLLHVICNRRQNEYEANSAFPKFNLFTTMSSYYLRFETDYLVYKLINFNGCSDEAHVVSFFLNILSEQSMKS